MVGAQMSWPSRQTPKPPNVPTPWLQTFSKSRTSCLIRLVRGSVAHSSDAGSRTQPSKAYLTLYASQSGPPVSNDSFSNATKAFTATGWLRSVWLKSLTMVVILASQTVPRISTSTSGMKIQRGNRAENIRVVANVSKRLA